MTDVTLVSYFNI